MSIEKQPENDNFHTHPLPEVNEDYCSCCRNPIVHGYDNVIRVEKAPEGVLDLNGNIQGTEGVQRPKAFFHAKCFQEGHLRQKKVVECKYCGVFSMAKTLKDGSPITCKCACHERGEFCSLLITDFTRWKK